MVLVSVVSFCRWIALDSSTRGNEQVIISIFGCVSNGGSNRLISDGTGREMKTQ